MTEKEIFIKKLKKNKYLSIVIENHKKSACPEPVPIYRNLSRTCREL